MADVEFHGAENAPQGRVQTATQSGRVSKLVNMAGAVMSVALVIGIGVWGYRLLVRDVSGVPVVRALDGPMRIQPEDPGGQQTAHQGLSVNRVQADGVAEPTADRLLLAPAGMGVTEGDQAGLQRPAPRTQATPMTEAADAEVAADSGAEITAPVLLQEELPAPQLPNVVDDGAGVVVASTEPTAPEPSATNAATDAAANAAITEALALAEQIAAGTAPLSEPEAVTARVPVAIISASIKGVSKSPRPHSRPAGLNTTPATAPVEVAAAQVVSAPVADVDAASIKAGTRLAQLGAYDSAQIAQKEWDRLYGRFTEYMEGKSRVIQKAQSGGRTFYRLRAMGFDDLSDARRFCSALLAEKAACIPVKVR
ncbi:SPOR domain-containing protein [Profundibacter sp.]